MKTSKQKFQRKIDNEIYTLSNKVNTYLEEDSPDKAVDLLQSKEPYVVARIFTTLDPKECTLLYEKMGTQFTPEILLHLDSAFRDEFLSYIPDDKLATFLEKLSPEDVVEIIEDLDEIKIKNLLLLLPIRLRQHIVNSLTYPENTLGRLMIPDPIAVPSFWSVKNILQYLRKTKKHTEYYQIYVINPKYIPVGLCSTSRLLEAHNHENVTDLMEPIKTSFKATDSVEDVVNQFTSSNKVELPILGNNKKLIGAVNINDVLNIHSEETEEDLLLMGGISKNDFFSDIIQTTKLRFPWLIGNLGLAMISSIVIQLFDKSIERQVALAVLMPIIASLAGNSGIQSSTVTISNITHRNTFLKRNIAIIGKELTVGLFNGTLLAIIMAVITFVWFHHLELTLAASFSIFVVVTFSTFIGTIIPLSTKRMGLDPAISSGVILTTLTDMISFGIFLGLFTYIFYTFF